MPLVLDVNEPAIVRGIKTVGVGKKGSKPLTTQLAMEILEDLNAGKVSPAAKGAFFAGLLAKGVQAHEEVLGEAFPPGVLKDPGKLVQALAPDAPEFVRWICVQLLTGHTLDKQTAYDLGTFLFSNKPGDALRGAVASFLRVRYETDDEYEGLWKAMQETIAPVFRLPTPPGAPIVQMAEPFDGNDHSYMITPLVADYVQGLGFRVVHMVGCNSGPKLVLNLLDVAHDLPAAFARGNQDLAGPKPRFGWFMRQRDIAPAVDAWVNIRRQIIKRPFLATLERFLKPLDARIIVASAFHPPYGEKMTTLAQRAGYAGIMIIRNGMEGSMALPLKRPAKILLSARQPDGSYHRHEITVDAGTFLESIPVWEEKREQLTARENARLIKEYADKGQSGDAWFDARVKITCEGFRQGLQWLIERGGIPCLYKCA